MEKLQFFAPFEILYRPRKENVSANYLSRHPPQQGEEIPTFCIADLCAGMGTSSATRYAHWLYNGFLTLCGSEPQPYTKGTPPPFPLGYCYRRCTLPTIFQG
eukprot:scaffold753_cov390-Pavlova_lutheri.AAC.15